MRRKRTKLAWTEEMTTTFVKDYEAFRAGKMGKRAFYARYGKRSASAYGIKYLRMTGKMVPQCELDRRAVEAQTPQTKEKKFPNLYLRAVNKLRSEGWDDQKIWDLFFGAPAKLPETTVRKMETLVNAKGSVTVKLFAEDNQVKFVDVG